MKLKHILIITLFTILPAIGFSQIDPKLLEGNWVFENVSSSGDIAEDSLVKPFNLKINSDGEFQIITDAYLINGIWTIQDSILTLEGERSDKVAKRIETLQMQKLGMLDLVFEATINSDKTRIVTMSRKD
ncbi:MAG: hypothetical protein H6603_11445 [Flavobacteriales bacterium]|nr:hypothetical protein [Flavobacteriales bacterium]